MRGKATTQHRTHDGAPPPLYDVEPPPGISRHSASAWCGSPGHRRVIVGARVLHQLDELLAAWRCERCGRAAL